MAVEEQFYLTLPFAIRLLGRRALLRLICLTLAAAPLLRIAFFFHPANFYAWYSLMPYRADALVLEHRAGVRARQKTAAFLPERASASGE